MIRPFLFCALLLAAGMVRADVLPLAQVLDRAEDGAALQAKAAELRALDALKEQREAEAGWQWFGSGSTGHYHELVTEDLRDDYYGRDLALGLRHPLLGSLRRQVQAVSAVELEQQRQQAQRLLRLAEQRLALRSAYADWWRAEQEERWCKGLLPASQTARERLARRQQGGWLLPSQARLLDGQWQGLQQRCRQSALLVDDTRASLAGLADMEIGPGQQAEAESLSTQVLPLSNWRQALEGHPRLQERQDELRHAERNRQSPWYESVDSSFSVAQSYESRSGASKSGDGLVAALSLSAPFDLMNYGRARNREGEARHQAALAQLEAERQQLLQSLGQTLQAQRQAALDLDREREQLAVADQALREQRLRAERSVSESPAEELAVELERYNSGLRLIAAWHAAWLREAALRLFVDDDQALAGLLGPQRLDWTAPGVVGAASKGVGSTGWSQGVYLWKSGALLNPATRHAELRELRRAGMTRLYLGLDGGQVADIPALRKQLQDTLDDAHAQGVQVALLLGDPAWLEPGGRQGLLDLLGGLKGLPFDALHLDLEVEQLGWPVPDRRLRDWLDTLGAVSGVVSWPLELSSHPRWFAEPVAGATCVPCALPKRGVRQVDLMIYTRNPARSAELAESIARRWPALRFRLAQSVEPQLPTEESWAGASRTQLREQLERWRTRLQPAGITGVDWQDWTHFPR
ncbi:TolC family protein [Pseudomonas sp. JM0905a]|uniref:TolC family protein n=1 Tax=Pseudomonas sp. JM0905a TaxID=2772484 RepID=UPI00168A2B77|nr:TolC family protein [Pseudomonas sp. JM0905a]MBD2839487.1 TolC family protein [Pseudomonas sp. JM0905a]